MAVARIGTLIPLTYEQRVAGFTHILRLTYQDLLQLTSGIAQNVIPLQALGGNTNPSAGLLLCQAVPNVVTVFTSSGGAITTLTLSLGISAAPTQFVNAQDGKTAGFGVAYAAKWAFGGATAFTFTATIVGQTMASINAGQVDFYLEINDAGPLALVVQPSAT